MSKQSGGYYDVTEDVLYTLYILGPIELRVELVTGKFPQKKKKYKQWRLRWTFRE